MLFNSYEFLFGFLPLTVILFFGLARKSHALAAGLLALASLVFYAWWDPANLLVILPSIAFNFAMGKAITNSRDSARAKARVLLVLAVGLNLSALAFFKYTNFLITNLNDAMSLGLPPANINLPLGISFFTFTQIAYLVDAWRGEVKEYNPVHYALFVTYFPHLIAGPILHHKQMMPQFGREATYHPSARHVALGLSVFTVGLAKKVLIADELAPHANRLFDAANPGLYGFTEAWLGSLAYTFQLYFDFSGYSDMAVGLSLLFGITLPINFLSPYKSVNIIEFWRRWHITLSTFLRDYLYISLGGNRSGKARRYLNLLTTMLLGGLWHGANWTFVIWGGLHGLYLVINHGWQSLTSGRRAPAALSPWLKGLSVLLTFVAVVVAWVFFRADSVTDALAILTQMTDTESAMAPGREHRSLVNLLLVGLLACWALPNTAQLFGLAESRSRIRWQPDWRWALFIAGLFLTCVASLNNVTQFIYFQF
jgi:alginate O-acetyltransferase complex protein AlgI